MRNLRGTYVHRGDAARKRRRVKQVAFVAGSVLATIVVIGNRRTTTANAAPVKASRPIFQIGGNGKLRDDLESTKGELTLARARYERAEKIISYSTKYGIPAGMAGSVFDASLREGIEPELAFRLVRLESEFNPRAVSKVGAVGLTQLMPSTAKLFQKDITRDQLFTPATNLQIGFRYLRTLLVQYKGNVSYALLAYNRGEDAVWRDIRAGTDPGNGYDRWVLRGYKGKGLTD